MKQMVFFVNNKHYTACASLTTYCGIITTGHDCKLLTVGVSQTHCTLHC